MAELTKLTGTYIRSGSIPTTALGGGVVSSSAQVVNNITNQNIRPAEITASGHIVPSTTEMYDLGTPDKKFRDLYLSGSTIYLGTLALSDSGGTLAVSPSGSPAGTSSPVSGAFTGSFLGELYATNNVPSSSAQVKAFLPDGTVSSSTQVVWSSVNYNTDLVSSSNQVKTFLPDGTVSASSQYPGWVTGSSQIDITQTTNYTTFSSSIATTDTVQTSRLSALENVTGSYATTGSNIFVGTQSFSNTTNTTSYLDGAIHVAGGMSVRQDLRVSGSVTINGLLTAVSMSTQYVTSSQYNVGVSKITLNDDDVVRFAGISIYDSGSASPTSASIFWDSLQHRFIYENLSGSSYNSSIIIAGPKHTGSLGDEPTLTSGYVPYATGGDHIDNSVIYQSGSNIGIGVTNTSTVGARVKIGTTTRTGKFFDLDAIGGENWIIDSNNTAGSTDVLGIYAYGATGLYIKDDGNVGINITTPVYRLDISGSGDIQQRINSSGTDAGLMMVGSRSYVIYSGKAGSGIGTGNFSIYDATAGLARLTISGSGNVGIGTTNPVTKFHIAGSSNDIGVRMTNTTSNKTFMTYTDTSGNYIVYDVTADNNRFTISSAGTGSFSGNVGIGTATPAAILHIQGGNLTFGKPGNGTNTSGRWLSIEGNAAADGEGSSRIFFSEHNSTTVDMDGYGMSLGYRGGGTSITGVSGNTWTGLSQIDNGEWAMFGHDANPTGSVIMRGSRTASYLSIMTTNVGIGTTTPSFKLHVDGGTSGATLLVEDDTRAHLQLKTTNAGQQYAFIRFVGATNNFEIGQRNDTGVFYLNPTINAGETGAAIVITESGNVGIGNVSPSVTLHVRRDSADDSNGHIQYENANTGTGAATNAQLIGKSRYGTLQYMVWENYGARIGMRSTANGGAGDLYFTAGTDSSAMIVKSNGNVGIGRTNPQTTLDVYGPIWGTEARFGDDPTSATYLNIGAFGSTAYLAPVSNMKISYEVGGTGIHEFRTGGSVRTVITAGGNVGIGTTNPSSKLDVRGDVTLATTSQSGRIDFGTSAAIAIYRDNSYDFVVQQNESSGYPLYLAGAGNVVVSIDANNNETDRKFIVGSNAVKSSNELFSVNEGGNAYLSGTLTEASSITLKENINPITNALSIVEHLQGYVYDRKDGSAKNQSGLIAEEVANILPGVVTFDKEGNPNGVQYTKIIAYLVESIKELKSELDELKRQ